MADDRTLAKSEMDSSVAWGCRKDSGMEGVLGGHGDAPSRPPRGLQSAGGGTESTILMLPFFDDTCRPDRRHIALQPDRVISLACMVSSPLLLPGRGLSPPRGLLTP
jgi:hypothetical protein